MSEEGWLECQIRQAKEQMNRLPTTVRAAVETAAKQITRSMNGTQ